MAVQRSVLIVGIPLVGGLYVIHVFFGNSVLSQPTRGGQVFESHLHFLFLVHKLFINADTIKQPVLGKNTSSTSLCLQASKNG